MRENSNIVSAKESGTIIFTDAVDSYHIVAAKFLDSVYSVKALEDSEVPEIAFVGRSNVGKSSVINALCRQKSLARTSKTPGRTQSLNFFEIVYHVHVAEQSADNTKHRANKK